MDLMDLFCKISIDTSEYERGIAHAQNLAYNFTSGVEKIAGSVLKVATVFTGAATAVGGFAYTVGSGFEAGMSEVQAICSATDDELAKLEDQALSLAKTTKFSASEAAEGYKYMAMAGWDVQSMMDGLPGVMNLAAASNTDLATTSDILTDSLTAMNLEAADAPHAADIIAATATSSNTNVSLLGETFKYVTPLAGALNYSMEDLSLGIGLMANSGIKGSQAGTALRSILTRLVDPPKDCADAMDKYNISMKNEDGTMKSLYDVMENLRSSLSGLNADEQAAAASAIGGQEALSGLLAIVNASPEDFNKLSDAINSADGMAQNMAETMQDNLKGKITILMSALDGLGNAFYKKFQEPAKKAVEKVTEVVNNFDLDAFLDKLNRVADAFLQWSPAIAAVAGAVSGLYAGFKALQILDSVSKAVIAFNAALSANPIVLVVTLIASLAAALVGLYASNEKFRNAVNSAWDAISKKIMEVVEFVQPYIHDAMEFISTTVSAALESLKPGIEAMRDAFTHAWNIIQMVWEKAAPFFEAVWDVIKMVFSVVGDVLGGFFRIAWEAVKSIWSVATGYFTAVWNTIAGIFSVVESVLSGDFQEAWDAIMRILSGWDEFFQKLMDNLKDIFGDVLTIFVDVGKNIVEGIKEGIGSAWDALTRFVSGLWDGIKNIFKVDVQMPDGTVSGSHAGGLDYVPYNNYLANLHRGEMVLTASEARDYRKGQNGTGDVSITQYIYAAKQTPVELAATTEAYFQQARWAL